MWSNCNVLYLFRILTILCTVTMDRPKEGVLNNPDKVSITNARNFYIQNEDIALGTWHILPGSYPVISNRTNKEFEVSLSNGEPIVLYIHGNMGSRASEHRLKLYRVLQDLNFHVITFDYRSFGDSTHKTPCERGVESDCLAVVKWLRRQAEKSPIFLWGHSLGTGMATHVAANMSNAGFEFNGVILEAPFNDMPSEIKEHPFGTVFRIFPWYNKLFSEPYHTNGEDFSSIKYIRQFAAPIMILHSEDDHVIPSKLGLKLYRSGLKHRCPTWGPITRHTFDAKRKFGHKGLVTATEMPEILRSFTDKYKDGLFQKSNVVSKNQTS